MVSPWEYSFVDDSYTMALFMVFCSVVICFHNPSVCLFIFVSFLYSDTLNTSKCIRLSNRSKLENTKVYCLFVSLECPTKLVAQNKGKQQQFFWCCIWRCRAGSSLFCVYERTPDRRSFAGFSARQQCVFAAAECIRSKGGQIDN